MRYLFLYLLALLPFAAQAQCPINTPPCAKPFIAIDVATGQEVQALCVGRAVRFDLGCGRAVPNNLLYYNALPTTAGTFTTPTNCNFVPNQLANNTYTPASAGTSGVITISELANDPLNPAVGTVYVRNFPLYDSPRPGFTLTPCPNNNVSLLVTSGGYDQYFVQVNAAPLIGPIAANTSTTVAAAAGNTITVVGQYTTNALCSNTSTQTVPTLAAPTTPVLGRLTTQSLLPGSLLFDTGSLTAGYLYDVQRSVGGTFQRVATVAAGSTTYTLPNAPAGLYRIGRRDVCHLDSAFSPVAPTLELRGASLNNVNTLTWQAGGAVTGYLLLRDGAVLATLPGTATSYPDAAVTCGTRYVYRLQASTAAGPNALANDVAVQTVSTLAPPAPFVNASFSLTNQVVLTAFAASGAALTAGGQVAYTRQGGLLPVPLGSAPTANDTLRDPALLETLQAAPPCYMAVLQSMCGIASTVSPATCPSLLTAQAVDPAGLTAQLSWSAFRGPAGTPATYRVLTLNPAGVVLKASAPTTALTYFDPTPPTTYQTLRYRIEASGAGLPAGTVSYSNVATVVRPLLVVVPSAFTPNGDGLNDVLEVKGRYINSFTFVIVDRNGQEVFRASDRTQTWDGTIRGHAPVNAVYVWRFLMLDDDNQTFTQTGTVTIVK
ncbi:MAG: gliding motility-associated C-terminal domain-containing protein [Janthinobacterium lividum]